MYAADLGKRDADLLLATGVVAAIRQRIRA